MRISKRIISCLLIIAICICCFAGFSANASNTDISSVGTQSVSHNFTQSFTLTGNGATDVVAVANAQIGRSKASLGYTEAWCADFVSDCAKLAGQSAAVPFNGGVSYLYNAVLNAGGYQVSSPQAGDLVFYYCTRVGAM